MKATVRWLGVTPYIVHETPLTFEPEKMTLWWRILRGPVDSIPDGAEVTSCAGEQTWTYLSPSTGFRLHLETEEAASRKDMTPVPPPKTKTETRWHLGHWEKLTKRGWVPA